MSRREPERPPVVVVGASAGGVEALREMMRTLPRDFPAAMFVTLHVPAEGSSMLPAILTRAGELVAVHAEDGDPITRARVSVAPPDKHLLLRGDHVHLTRGPRENGHRPAIDPLFRSAALCCGPATIGIILSGALDDGVAGLAAVKARGGTTIVQDPEDALYSGMPTSALDKVEVDHVVPATEIGRVLMEVLRTMGTESETPSEPHLTAEVGYSVLEPDVLHAGDVPGEASELTCPECNGALWENEEDGVLQYRCRVGHAYAEESLVLEQSAAVEAALWVALRSLEERAALLRRLGDRANKRGNTQSTKRFYAGSDEATEHAEVLRSVLVGRKSEAAIGEGVPLESTGRDEAPAKG